MLVGSGDTAAVAVSEAVSRLRALESVVGREQVERALVWAAKRDVGLKREAETSLRANSANSAIRWPIRWPSRAIDEARAHLDAGDTFRADGGIAGKPVRFLSGEALQLPPLPPGLPALPVLPRPRHPFDVPMLPELRLNLPPFPRIPTLNEAIVAWNSPNGDPRENVRTLFSKVLPAPVDSLARAENRRAIDRLLAADRSPFATARRRAVVGFCEGRDGRPIDTTPQEVVSLLKILDAYEGARGGGRKARLEAHEAAGAEWLNHGPRDPFDAVQVYETARGMK